MLCVYVCDWFEAIHGDHIAACKQTALIMNAVAMQLAAVAIQIGAIAYATEYNSYVTDWHGKRTRCSIIHDCSIVSFVINVLPDCMVTCLEA